MSSALSKSYSRRNFLYQSALASMAIVCAGQSAWANLVLRIFGSGPDSKIKGVQVGVITYSFRSMPGKPEQLLQYCIDAGISAIELMGDTIEEYAGKPANTVKLPPRIPGQQQQLTDEQKAQIAAYQKEVADWRAAVSMDKFEEIRKLYNKAGVRIYAFKPNALNPGNTDAEIEYALKAAKAGIGG